MDKKQALQTLGLGLVVGGTIVSLSNPARAGDVSAVSSAISDVNSVATMLTGLITAFTTVLITPMGISASMKIFKTLVLFNL